MAAQTWGLWIPDAASRGVCFALAVLEPAADVLVHAAPTLLRVEVQDADGRRVALGDGLRREGDSPMTRLRVEDGEVSRSELWPGPGEEGLPVILPGGEVGLLRSWWNADDRSEWRWTVEFQNRR